MNLSYDQLLEHKDEFEKKRNALLLKLEEQVADTISAKAGFNNELIKAELDELLHIAKKVVEQDNAFRKVSEKLFAKDLAHDYK